MLFAGGYFYNLAQAVCPIPITYRIGDIDDRFDLTEDQAKVAVAEAAEIWEKATGQNLFTYDDEADFPINFIFDERQEFTDAVEQFEDKLDVAENVNQALNETYSKLVDDYDVLKAQYESKLSALEARFNTYNQTVEEYNAEGGAPPDAFEELEAERRALDAEQASVNRLVDQLQELAGEINEISERGSALAADYNEKTEVFNERFGEPKEFTQGDYNYERINIYTYKDQQDLEVILVHELGHALTLGHVAGEGSVMYHLNGGQPQELTLSENDLAEFNRICGDMNLYDKIVYRLKGY